MSILTYKNRIFMLQTQETSYVIGLGESGLLENLYWGKRIHCIEDFIGVSSSNFITNLEGPQQLREECSGFGGMRFKETSLQVVFEDGSRDFRYKVKEIAAQEQLLEITLEDVLYPFEVTLHYEVYESENIIKKWRTAKNTGQAPIVLERFYSAEYGLPGLGYQSLQFNGRWGAEFSAYSEPVDSGKKIYESLYGLSGHTVNPCFIVHKDADETSGEVYYGVLEYSGNFKSVIEAANCRYVNILLGISDTDFEWILGAEESFTAPPVYAGYSAQGFEKMTHVLTEFNKTHIMPENFAKKELSVIYNSWYSTGFAVRCEEQIALAKKAARLGVELFVVDDGWFEGRENDKAGLGDWWVDKEKFPNGLRPLIDSVKELGMNFGIWIEPEMVNPNSKLYEQHPEWVYQYPNREILMGRNQYMLDMTNKEVVDYLIGCFDKLLEENDISYIKWDMNRYAAEMSTPYIRGTQKRGSWFNNTMGIYRLIKVLRERHPNVEFEACASGGGRVDYGTLRYFDEYWPSDNTDGLDRLTIQEGYSYLYPIKYMRSLLTEEYGMNYRNIPTKFNVHCAMCGALGIGVDLLKIDDEKLEELKGYVEQYKEIRHLVQFGKLYRLQSLKTDLLQAVQYVNEKESAVFVFLDKEQYGLNIYRVKLRGLKNEQMYTYSIQGKEEKKTGAFLMNVGLQLDLKGDYASELIKLKEV